MTTTPTTRWAVLNGEISDDMAMQLCQLIEKQINAEGVPEQPPEEKENVMNLFDKRIPLHIRKTGTNEYDVFYPEGKQKWVIGTFQTKAEALGCVERECRRWPSHYKMGKFYKGGRI